MESSTERGRKYRADQLTKGRKRRELIATDGEFEKLKALLIKLRQSK